MAMENQVRHTYLMIRVMIRGMMMEKDLLGGAPMIIHSSLIQMMMQTRMQFMVQLQMV